jgi:hypothetical protein
VHGSVTQPAGLNILPQPVGIQRHIFNSCVIHATILAERVSPRDPPSDLYYSPASPFYSSFASQETDDNCSIINESVAAVSTGSAIDVIDTLFQLLPQNYDHTATIRRLKGISSYVPSRSSLGSLTGTSRQMPSVLNNPLAVAATSAHHDETILITSDSDMDSDVDL